MIDMKISLDLDLFNCDNDGFISKNLESLLNLLNKVTCNLFICQKSTILDGNIDTIHWSKIRRQSPLCSNLRHIINQERLNYIISENNILNYDELLSSLIDNNTDFLITEDPSIHESANDFGIDDQVLSIEDAIKFFKQHVPSDSIVVPFALKHESVDMLNLDDSFFDSLRKEYYPEFDDWFIKISNKKRKCLYYKYRDQIKAILIYKIEDEPINDSYPPFPKKKRFKISTFKVDYLGQKIGELFIKLSIDLSINNHISELYLTHFTQKPKDRLVELISEYGFYKAGITQRGDDIFMKKLIIDHTTTKKLTPLDIIIKYYPSFYDGKDVRKFIVPIRPEYHNKLFTDMCSRQLTLVECDGFIVEGNTIKKSYICNSKNRQINPGDIILFYRSKDWKMITSLGIVESIHYNNIETNKIMNIVSKRTVFSKKEIKDMKKPVTIILFRHHFHLKRPLGFNELKEFGVISTAPISIMKIDHEKYIKIKKRGGIDGRYTIH